MRVFPWVFLVLLLGMCGVVAGLFFTDAPAPLGPHPEHTAMTKGSLEHQQHGGIVALGATFGVLQLVFFVTCLVFGIGERGRPFVVFLVGGALHVLVFGALVAAHARYLSGESSELVLSLPAPTAWMLYVLWPLPVLFAVWYSRRFDDAVYPAESRERFRRLLRSRSDSSAPQGGAD